MTIKVLFLSQQNAARSQIAEHLLNRFGNGHFEAHSAGSAPEPIHPLVIKVLEEADIDATEATSKPLELFEADHFDYIINICDQSSASCRGQKPECPYLDSQEKNGCWGFTFKSEGDELAQLRTVREQISNRLRVWIPAVDKPQH